MRLSIIIPSFMQGAFIEKTLQSIFSQEHADVEVLVIDGGSTDETVSVIKKYASKIAYWVSEPDAGQTEAINKGLKKMTGSIWAYLNSDDLLLPGALAYVQEVFQKNKDLRWLSGEAEIFDATGIQSKFSAKPVEQAKDYIAPWNRKNQYVFPFSGACFMHRKVIEKIGFFDPSYHYSMDIEYYVRAIFKGSFQQELHPKALAQWRWQEEAKTMQKGIAYAFREDEIRLAKSYCSYLPEPEQYTLEKEIKEEEKDLICRKAFYALKLEKNRRKGLLLLFLGLLRFPSLLIYRYWSVVLQRLFMKNL